jgi:MFS transporter, SP family, general alpha glucoside:H+ symporter
MSEKLDIKNSLPVNITESTVDELFVQANIASVQEKEVGILEAIRKYPKEIFWTLVFAVGLVMAGYDAQIISSLYVPSFLHCESWELNGTDQLGRYGLSAFNKRFGDLQPDGSYEVSAVSIRICRGVFIFSITNGRV